MKKSIKNTIMIGMAAILIGTSAITYSYAQIGNAKPQAPMSMSQFDGNNQGNRFDEQLPDFENGNHNRPDFNKDNSQPPQQNQQQGDATQQDGAPQGEQPRENAQNEQKSDNSNAQTTSVNGESETADMPNFPQQMPNGKEGFSPRGRSFSKVTTILCYAFLAVQLAVLLMIIAYLIMSKMNKLSFNQVFPEKNKELPEQ